MMSKNPVNYIPSLTRKLFSSEEKEEIFKRLQEENCILVTDHKAVRGLEFKTLIVMVSKDEHFERHIVPESLARSTSKLYMVVWPQTGLNLQANTLDKVIDAWISQEVVSVTEMNTNELPNPNKSFEAKPIEDKRIVTVYVNSTVFPKIEEDRLLLTDDQQVIMVDHQKRKYVDRFYADVERLSDSHANRKEPSFVDEKLRKLMEDIASYDEMDDDEKKNVFGDMERLIRDNDYESFKHLELPSIVHMRYPDQTVLHIAAIYNRPHMMTLLLSHGADHTAGDVFGETPYHICAMSDDGYDGLLLLTSHDEAAVNLVNYNHQTALHQAAQFGVIANVRLLLQHGADVEVEDTWGRKPDHDGLVCKYTSNKDNKEEIQTMIAEYRKKKLDRN